MIHDSDRGSRRSARLGRTASLPLLIAFTASLAGAQSFVEFDSASGRISLGNEKFRRVIQVDRERHAFFTTGFTNALSGVNLCLPGSDEFAFNVDERLVTGGLSSKMFQFVGQRVENGLDGRKTLRAELLGAPGSAADGLRVALFYEIYPHLAVVRKWLEIENLGKRERTLSGLEWERLNLATGWPSMATIYSDYGQAMNHPPFAGGAEDPAVLVYFWQQAEGFVVGNEAPGVMKRIGVTGDQSQVSIMMNPDGTDFPFRKYLKPGETFRSPKGFIVLYHGNTWQNAFEEDFSTFIRRYLGVKLFERRRPPMFVYSPYVPFDADFNEALYHQLIDAAADAGVEYFQVTWAWSDDIEPLSGVTAQGDYRASPRKFPHGLKPIIDHIQARGMKPCLYFALANVDKRGRVFQAHPEWAALDSHGKPETLHQTEMVHGATMCLGSPWYDYILEQISRNVSEYGLKWVMLDLSSVTSAYILDKTRTGCHAANHQHKDREESLYMIYERMTKLFDTLRERFPDLYIDCTFELWGYHHIIDYSLIEHADGDWISNIPTALIARQLRYDRGRVVPPSPMLIGNLRMDQDNPRMSFASLAASTVVMLGDLRKLSAEEKGWFREQIAWLTELEDKYHYSRFYQVSDVFGRPAASGWDGCVRFNPEANGGILCLFRNDSPEPARTFQLPWVNADSRYRIYSSRSKRELGTYDGRTLRTGLRVEIPDRQQADILSIEAIH